MMPLRIYEIVDFVLANNSLQLIKYSKYFSAFESYKINAEQHYLVSMKYG